MTVKDKSLEMDFHTQIQDLVNESTRDEDKRRFIQRSVTDEQYAKALRREEAIKQVKEIDLSDYSQSEVDRLVKETDQYLKAVKNSPVFLNSDFNGKIHYLPHNMILIAANSGSGKTTVGVNLALDAALQNKKVLMITNEEHSADVYNRITCLTRGWAYVNHQNFTDEHRNVFMANILPLSRRIHVVADDYTSTVQSPVSGITTTLEGFKRLMNSIIEKKIHYDLIILDYYQQISRSVERPNMQTHEILHEVGQFLNSFRLQQDAPIVVLAQKKPNSDEKDFKETLEGRVSILNYCSMALEAVIDRDKSRTGFKIHKSRFSNSVFETIHVGFEKGRYVPYTEDFQHKVSVRREAEQTAEMMSKIKPVNFKIGAE